jgi:hypothetical protein
MTDARERPETEDRITQLKALAATGQESSEPIILTSDWKEIRSTCH